jgi:FMN phosphatase YigB (HAD superfamily)
MRNNTREKPEIGLLVLDLDNTLWDWVDVWVESFSALVDGLVDQTGLDPAELKREISAVHQLRGTTEYSFLLDELPSLKPFLRGKSASERFNTVLHKQNSIRKHKTQLYPTVLPTLLDIKSRGVKIVAYTESLAYWTEWRIRLTGLDGILDALYSSPDHDMPTGVSLKKIRTLPQENYGLKKTIHKTIDRGISKPNPRVLQEIIAQYGSGTKGVVYVGDNVSKDIAMAQAVGVFDVHAAYGEAHKRPEYELLREVTHWTPEAVARERSTRPGALPTPSYILQKTFSEIVDHFEFTSNIDIAFHMDLWTKAVDVQQHFNDIGWRIRALGLTALTFTFGATGFAYVNSGPILIPNYSDNVSLATFVPIVGLVLWGSFWFMDAFWFHRLLVGAVSEGTRLERLLQSVNVRVDLGSNIGRASPIGKLHSLGKLHLFYAVSALLLVLTCVALLLVGAPPLTTDPLPIK